MRSEPPTDLAVAVFLASRGWPPEQTADAISSVWHKDTSPAGVTRGQVVALHAAALFEQGKAEWQAIIAGPPEATPEAIAAYNRIVQSASPSGEWLIKGKAE